MSTTVQQNSNTPQSITDGLSQLRAGIARWLLVHGVSRFLVIIVGWIVIDFAIDRLFHMDRAQRLVMLLLALAGFAFVFYRRVMAPLGNQPGDDALALEIEQRKPESGQSLISALQFSRMEDATDRGYSPAMLQATIQTGAEFASNTKFSDIIHGKQHLKNLLILLVAGAALLGIGAASFATESMGTWFNRNILLGNRQWPMDVMMAFDHLSDGKLVIPRGDDWPLSVLILPESLTEPDEVVIDLRTSVGERTERLEKSSGETGDANDTGAANSFSSTLVHVDDISAIRARSGRSYTEWIPVELIDRPEVTDLRLTVIPPEYTREEPTLLPPGFGPYMVLPGSRLQLRGTATKPLSRANVAVSGQKISLSVDAQNPNQFVGELDAEHVLAESYHVTVADTEKLLVPGMQRPGPLLSKKPLRFTLRSKTDRIPQVRAKLSGVSNMVVANAVVPVSGLITDDYSVEAVRLQHKQINPQGEQAEEESTDWNSIVKTPGARLKFDHNLELSDFNPEVGTTFHFRIEADDNNTISGPGVGESSTFLLRIVSAEELRADLLRREKDLRLEFERIIKSQDTLLTDTKALTAESRSAAKLSSEQLEILIKIQKRQKLIGTNLANVARRIENIAIEVANNRLEEDDGPIQTRLKEEIVQPVWDVADDSVPRLVDAFDTVRQKSDKIGDRNEAATGVIRRQEDILADLREILSHMVKAEGFQEAINMLYEVERAQQELIKRTQRERQDAIRDLLNDPPTNSGNTENNSESKPDSGQDGENP